MIHVNINDLDKCHASVIQTKIVDEYGNLSLYGGGKPK
jgi:hypothetical protein